MDDGIFSNDFFVLGKKLQLKMECKLKDTAQFTCRVVKSAWCAVIREKTCWDSFFLSCCSKYYYLTFRKVKLFTPSSFFSIKYTKRPFSIKKQQQHIEPLWKGQKGPKKVGHLVLSLKSRTFSPAVLCWYCARLFFSFLAPGVQMWDQYQCLDNCPPTPPLTQH